MKGENKSYQIGTMELDIKLQKAPIVIMIEHHTKSDTHVIKIQLGDHSLIEVIGYLESIKQRLVAENEKQTIAKILTHLGDEVADQEIMIQKGPIVWSKESVDLSKSKQQSTTIPNEKVNKGAKKN